MAGGAAGSQCFAGAAVMTTQLAVFEVYRKARIAVVAAGHPAAVVALERGGIASAIEKQEGLLLVDLYRLAQGSEQSWA